MAKTLLFFDTDSQHDEQKHGDNDITGDESIKGENKINKI